jgi:hypothetical protein
MRKMRHNLFGLLALLVAGASLMIVLGAAGQSVSAPALSGATNQEYTMPTSSGPGIPAIRPSQAGVPAFAEADVRQYLATSGFPGGRTLSGAKPTITQIVFVTSKQASEMMQGESVGLSDAALVCYVHVQGPFSGASISAPGARPGGDYQMAHMVFDAQTGNLLLWGVG